MADNPSTSSGLESDYNILMDLDVLEEVLESNQIISPVQRAFHIDVVLKTIAVHLNFCDLMNFRLINKTANVVASSILLREDLPIVNLKYSLKCNEFLSNHRQSVDDLVNVITKSERFPCASYSFDKGNLGCEKLQPLLKVIGPHLKTLSIKGGRHPHYWFDKDEEQQFKMKAIVEQKYLVDLLKNKLPKLETLYIGGLFYEWIRKDDTGLVYDQRLELPTLKFLYCINNDDSDMFEDGLEMIARAPLLKEVHGYKNRYFGHLGTIIPIEAIKSYKHLSYHYCYEDKEIFENLLKFAIAGPMLNDFEFHLYLPYYSIGEEYQALIKILQSSQDTLKNLRFNDDAILFDFPVFTSLKNLTIDVLCNGNGDLSSSIEYVTKKKPKAADASCFPNVETFTIVVSEGYRDDWYGLNFKGSFSEVKTLNIIHSSPSFKGFEVMFPNIKTMRIEWNTYRNVYLDGMIMETFESLEEIEFIGLNSELDKKCNCDWWDEMFIEDDENENIESCYCIKRFIGVILKSKRLKKIKFLYDCNNPPQTDSLFDAIKQHVIELLPELQVTLAFDHQSEFANRQEQMIHHPRIRFVHEVYKATPEIYICKR